MYRRQATPQFTLSEFSKHEFDPKRFVAKLTANIFSDFDGGGGGSAGGGGGGRGGGDGGGDGDGGGGGVNGGGVGHASSSSMELDPSQFKAVFSESVACLRALRDEAQAELLEQAQHTRTADAFYRRDLGLLKGKLAELQERSLQLDRRLARVAHIAGRVNAGVTTPHEQIERTQAGSTIIQYFLSFNSDHTPRVFRSTSTLSDLRRAAREIQALQMVVSDLSLTEMKRGVERIAETSNKIEQELLERFLKAYEARHEDKHALKDMKDCALTLSKFKGNHDTQWYFHKALVELNHQEAADSALDVGDGSEVDAFEHALGNFYVQIATICEEEGKVIREVFPEPVSVSLKLIDLLFELHIGEFLRATLNRPSLENDVYLEMLDSAYQLTAMLVDDIQSLLPLDPHRAERPPRKSSAGSATSPSVTSMGTSPEVTEFELDGGASAIANAAGTNEVMRAVYGMFQNLFFHYRDDYLDRERVLLEDSLGEVIQERVLAVQQSMRSSGGGVQVRGRGVDDESTRARKWLPPVLNTRVIEALIKPAKQAVERAGRLAESSHKAEYCRKLVDVILHYVKDLYLLPAMQGISHILPSGANAQAHLAENVSHDSSFATAGADEHGATPAHLDSPPDTFLFRVIGYLGEVVAKFEAFFQHSVEPLLANARSPQALNAATNCRNKHNEAIISIEQDVILALGVQFAATSAYIQRIIASQSVTVYNPTDDSGDLLGDECSEAIERLVDFIAAQGNVVIGSLSGQNVDEYLSKLGEEVHSLFSKHLLQNFRLSISSAGAFMLTSDVKMLQECFEAFHLAAVDRKFAELRALCSVFLIPADNVAAMLTENAIISAVPIERLVDFLQLRADYEQNESTILAQLNLQRRHRQQQRQEEEGSRYYSNHKRGRRRHQRFHHLRA